ncbi:flagellar motor switch protein FliM [Parendozoicomonas haliclonae]|uniref:Flagellar motor switch protein FliM n=1 Tax=Parendozoicomonas haliclonae TaxID=1960125 RepID=A0A1X7ANA2_9GAMM|nr:flagellar motor switch protein FliM [Parendozoicomonas haliclonae]
MELVKPCNLFEVGGRMMAARRAADDLARLVARSLTESLISMTGDGVTVRAQSQFPVTPSRIKETSITTFICENQGTGRKGIVDFDNALCCALMERACGGAGAIDGPLEMLTLAEHRFAERIIALTLDLLGRAMHCSSDLALVKERDLEKNGFASKNLFLLTMTIETATFNGSIKVWLSEESMTFGMMENHVNSDLLIEALGQVPLPVSAVLSRRQSTLGNVLSLKVGDTLPLTLPGTAEVFVGGQPLGQARVVAKNNNLALELQSVVKADTQGL